MIIREAASERSRRKIDGGGREEQDEHSKKIFRNTLNGKSAWQRHQEYVERYLKRYEKDGGQARNRMATIDHKNDFDVLKESHHFLREDDGEPSSSTYNDQVAKKYYDSLFKDLVLTDLKHFKSGNVAFRWRSEEDVIDGIGQFTCANIRCEHHKSVQTSIIQLTPFEVNFAYTEQVNKEKQNKQALVKVTLCQKCARKLRHSSGSSSSSSRQKLQDQQHRRRSASPEHRSRKKSR